MQKVCFPPTGVDNYKDLVKAFPLNLARPGVVGLNFLRTLFFILTPPPKKWCGGENCADAEHVFISISFTSFSTTHEEGGARGNQNLKVAIGEDGEHVVPPSSRSTCGGPTTV